MNADGRRRFGIADASILIAGLAAGMALVRAVTPDLTPGEVWHAVVRPPEGWSPSYAYAFTLDFGTIIGGPSLAAWTPACLVLQVIGPRPRWRRLRRRPG